MRKVALGAHRLAHVFERVASRAEAVALARAPVVARRNRDRGRCEECEQGLVERGFTVDAGCQVTGVYGGGGCTTGSGSGGEGAVAGGFGRRRRG